MRAYRNVMGPQLGEYHGQPIVEVGWIEDNRIRQAAFDCPFCGETHRHGFDEYADYNTLSHRCAHCPTVPEHDGYWLAYTTNTENFNP